jgi:hypothetical protein
MPGRQFLPGIFISHQQGDYEENNSFNRMSVCFSINPDPRAAADPLI